MNLLPFVSNTLVKRLPLHSARSNTVKYLLAANVGLFGLYLLQPGPQKLTFRKTWVMEADSGYHSFVFSHFAYTSLPSLLFNGGILYTIGNYHVLKYGANHFLALYGIGLLAGAAITALDLYRNRNQRISGGIAGTGVLLGYNIFKNS